jgi:hypothetical protein
VPEILDDRDEAVPDFRGDDAAEHTSRGARPRTRTDTPA